MGALTPATIGLPVSVTLNYGNKLVTMEMSPQKNMEYEYN